MYSIRWVSLQPFLKFKNDVCVWMKPPCFLREAKHLFRWRQKRWPVLRKQGRKRHFRILMSPTLTGFWMSLDFAICLHARHIVESYIFCIFSVSSHLLARHLTCTSNTKMMTMLCLDSLPPRGLCPVSCRDVYGRKHS